MFHVEHSGIRFRLRMTPSHLPARRGLRRSRCHLMRAKIILTLKRVQKKLPNLPPPALSTSPLGLAPQHGIDSPATPTPRALASTVGLIPSFLSPSRRPILTRVQLRLHPISPTRLKQVFQKTPELKRALIYIFVCANENISLLEARPSSRLSTRKVFTDAKTAPALRGHWAVT